MTDLTPDHPAVEAASMAPFEGREWMADLERMHDGKPFREARKPGLADALNAAFPHLTSATEENLSRLRNTEAGRALLVQGWHDGYDDGYDTGYCAGKREHRQRRI